MGLFTKRTWLDSIVEYPTRRTIHDVNAGTDTVVTVTRNVGTVTQSGDVWNATNMNELEGRIESAFVNGLDRNDFPITTTWTANADTGDYSTYPYKQFIASDKYTATSAPDCVVLAGTPTDFMTSAEEEDAQLLCKQVMFTASGITVLAKEQTTNALTLRVTGR